MNKSQATSHEVEHIYKEWDKALSNKDIEAVMALYSEEAVAESPLIFHLLGTGSGICKGKQEIRRLIEVVIERHPAIRKYHRKGFFTDGNTLVWEYPRSTPEGEQMDFVHVMEIQEGLIINHRVYWGWKGFQVLQENAYHK